MEKLWLNKAATSDSNNVTFNIKETENIVSVDANTFLSIDKASANLVAQFKDRHQIRWLSGLINS